MKGFAAISLICLFLSSTVFKSFLILDYWNRKAEITRTCCVNKNRPELKCHGKCYINTRLKTMDEQGKQEWPVKVEVKETEPFLPVSIARLPQEAISIPETYGARPTGTYSYMFYSAIFHPPLA